MPTTTIPLVVVAAMGAAAVARLVVREYRRVNDELEAFRRAAEPVNRSRLRTLRRDPDSGEYRPH